MHAHALLVTASLSLVIEAVQATRRQSQSKSRNVEAFTCLTSIAPPQPFEAGFGGLIKPGDVIEHGFRRTFLAQEAVPGVIGAPLKSLTGAQHLVELK
jgi:hypothetical protein